MSFISCEPMSNSGFWKMIKLDFQPEIQSVKAIQNFGVTTIFIAGAKTTTPGVWDVRTDQAYFRISNDGGQSWKEKADFSCNSFDRMFSEDGVLIVEGSKYVGNPELFLGSEALWLKYYIKENRWDELKILDERVGSLVRVIDKNTYIFRNNKGYANHDYMITRNGGESWIECSLPLDNKRDVFNDYCLQGNKLWGIRKHEPLAFDKSEKEYRKLTSIDIDTWEIVDEIPLGNTKKDKKNNHLSSHHIKKIIADGEILYLLGQDDFKSIGYIWKMNVHDKEIKVQDSFELTKDQSPVELFFHEERLIVVYMDMTTFLPSYTLLYKKLDEKSWHEESFPYLTSSPMNFSNGVLMGIAEDNKIYYKQF